MARETDERRAKQYLDGDRQLGRSDGTGVVDSPVPLRRLLPYLDVLGIARISDITGLDRIGIPVVQAVRPLGLANAVTQGKGLDQAAAAVSAIMEAAEQFFAERIAGFRVVVGCADELGVRGDQFIPHLLPDAPPDWRHVSTAWVEATDMIADRPGWLPLEMVHTAYVDPPLATDGLFSASTTGLACAFSEREAVLHGLLECVERDAIARAHRTHGFFQRFRIDSVTIADGTIQQLIGTMHEAGLSCAFWMARAAADVPVVWCQIMENGRRELITPYPADGFAADLDPVAAVRRALLEAAQSRLAAISGARDDITRAAFPRYTDWNAIEAHRRLHADGPRSIPFAALPTGTAAWNGDAPEILASALAQAGLSSVLCTRLDTAPIPEIAAVRVVVPELWPLTEG